MVPRTPTKCVCLTECDRKDPGPLGVVVLRRRLIKGYKMLARKRKEKKALRRSRGWKLNINLLTPELLFLF